MSLSNLTQYLPFLIPALLVWLGLLVAALVSIFRHKTYRVGNRVVWVVVSIVIGMIGPVVYFAVGRGEE